MNKILWFLAMLFYGFLDTSLTIFILTNNLGFEANNIALLFINWFGLFGLIIHKFLFIGFYLLIYKSYKTFNFTDISFEIIFPILMFIDGILLVINHINIIF